MRLLYIEFCSSYISYCFFCSPLFCVVHPKRFEIKAQFWPTKCSHSIFQIPQIVSLTCAEWRDNVTSWTTQRLRHKPPPVSPPHPPPIFYIHDWKKDSTFTLIVVARTPPLTIRFVRWEKRVEVYRGWCHGAVGEWVMFEDKLWFIQITLTSARASSLDDLQSFDFDSVKTLRLTT